MPTINHPVFKCDESTCYKVNLLVKGIKRRCKYTELHIVNMGYAPLDPIVDAILLSNAAESALELYFRPGSIQAVTLAFDSVTRNLDGGIHIESWEPFSKLNKRYSMSPKGDFV